MVKVYPTGAVKSKHVTLAAGVVSTVNLSGQFREVCVRRLTGTTPVYWTIGINGTAATPTVAGDDTRPLGVYPSEEDEVDFETRIEQMDVEVKLISAGTDEVMVVAEVL